MAAAPAAAARGQEAQEEGHRRRDPPARRRPRVQVPPPQAQAGASQGLAPDGGGVRDEPGTDQAAHGARGGRSEQGGRAPRITDVRRKPRGDHRRQVRPPTRVVTRLFTEPRSAQIPISHTHTQL